MFDWRFRVSHPYSGCRESRQDYPVESPSAAGTYGKSLTDSWLLNTMRSEQSLPNPGLEGNHCRTVLLNHLNSIFYGRDMSGRPLFTGNRDLRILDCTPGVNPKIETA